MIDRYSRLEMREIWSEESKYSSWAELERAHLNALVLNCKAPPSVITDFEKALLQKTADDFLRREKETGHDVIAFISEVGEAMGDSGCYLHQGLTSSDVLDSSFALRVRKSLELVLSGLAKVRENLAAQSFVHASTICIGRSHGIHAEPLSFGQVLTGHFAEFQRAHLDILAVMKSFSFGKLAGAVGQYSQISPTFEDQVLSTLDLSAEAVSTQVVPRDRHLRVSHALEAVANAVDRFSTNVRHWARTELGEVLEPFSEKQKGSSAMPHKKNPILAENLCGLARTVRGYTLMISQNTVLWHERDISHSSVERVAFPDAFATVDFMLERCSKLIEKMQVRPAVMRKNLDRTGGLWCSQSVLTSLVERGIGRTEAYELVQKLALPIGEKVAMGEVTPSAFKDALFHVPLIVEALGPDNLTALFEVERFLKHTDFVFSRVYGITPAELSRLKDISFKDCVPAMQTVVKITVELLPDVLDTEAKTILQDLHHTGVQAIGLRQQRTFHVRLSAGENLKPLLTYANDVLHNAVIESVSSEVVQ